MKQEEEKCCGNCCWFYGEMTDGEGFCALRDPSINETRCDFLCAYELHVSRQEMRHHMAVLLQYHMADEDMNHRFPGGEELEKAVVFAYKYMKVFSEL